jgi:hypothetical protein
MRRSLHIWQEVAIVHQEVETVKAAKDEVTLQVWPSRGAIQIEEGMLTEQQLLRQEADISMCVLEACRLHMAVTKVSYKSIPYRRRPGGKEEIQYHYKVSVLQSAATEILRKEGVPEKEGTPGWTEVQTGSIQRSGEDWLIVKDTMAQTTYDKTREVESISDRAVQALVTASGGAYRDHVQFEGFVCIA